tara:strand:+ start:139 stop:555 length:417 start_codon:yes stop_codon:yes gene_type:complete
LFLICRDVPANKGLLTKKKIDMPNNDRVAGIFESVYFHQTILNKDLQEYFDNGDLDHIVLVVEKKPYNWRNADASSDMALWATVYDFGTHYVEIGHANENEPFLDNTYPGAYENNIRVDSNGKPHLKNGAYIYSYPKT